MRTVARKRQNKNGRNPTPSPHTHTNTPQHSHHLSVSSIIRPSDALRFTPHPSFYCPAAVLATILRPPRALAPFYFGHTASNGADESAPARKPRPASQCVKLQHSFYLSSDSDAHPAAIDHYLVPTRAPTRYCPAHRPTRLGGPAMFGGTVLSTALPLSSRPDISLIHTADGSTPV
ncbi:hypothetical protein BC834DRAFT_88582 [Gloeopeniophorella convolvens]|nr:hypothetical protein BC834DRAFT_88582 [Gloeopeniophorella convolvens]